MSSNFVLSAYKDIHDSPNKTQPTPAMTLVDLLRFATVLLLVLFGFVVVVPLIVEVVVLVRGDNDEEG